MREAKCYKCKYTWEYQLKDIKVDVDGHDAIVTLYCPNCGKKTWAYNPNDLIEKISSNYVDSNYPQGKHVRPKFDWS